MSKRRSVLVVEDETDLAELVRHNVEREGFACRVTSNGRAAITEILSHPPDLVLLDRMLPLMAGDEVLAQMRRDPRTSAIPVIMLTAKAEESDQLVGLGLGADDYVTKPFSMKLLLARIQAVFRRMELAAADREILEMGPIRLNSERHEVSVNDNSVLLTATEFRLLKALIAANGRVLSRGQLIEAAMGAGVAVTDRTIDVHVTALRKKLGKAARWIHTIRGVGYTLREKP